jgi:hypothetical protein
MAINLKEQHKQILPEVYLWESFLSQEELLPIMEEINSKSWESDDRKHRPMFSFAQYKQRLENSIEITDGDVMDFDTVLLKKTGDGMLPHTDVWNCMNLGFTHEVEKNVNVEQSSFTFPRYAFILYFNDNYKGGEMCYPEYDFCYKPKAGDLIVHDVRVIHAVKKVKTGSRYYFQGMMCDKFWVEKEIADKINIPEPFIVDQEDPTYFYSVAHGPTDNLRLEEFKKTFINDGTYANKAVD